MKSTKETETMKKTFTYKNKRTGKSTESREQAKIWYEAGDEIEQWYFSEVLGKMICGLEWIH